MRLDLDCVRDILLTVEEYSGYNKLVYFPEHFSNDILQRYDEDTIRYHINQCILSDLIIPFIDGGQWDLLGRTQIRDLSPSGHEFIANIRNDSSWNRVKKHAVQIGTSSISAVIQIAKTLVIESITKAIQFPNSPTT